MRDGRRRHDWDQTALLAWMMAMANRDPKKRAPKIGDFHPMPDPRGQKRPKPKMRATVKDLIKIFVPPPSRGGQNEARKEAGTPNADSAPGDQGTQEAGPLHPPGD